MAKETIFSLDQRKKPKNKNKGKDYTKSKNKFRIILKYET